MLPSDVNTQPHFQHSLPGGCPEKRGRPPCDEGGSLAGYLPGSPRTHSHKLDQKPALNPKRRGQQRSVCHKVGPGSGC